MIARFMVMLAVNSGLALMYYLWQWEGMGQAGDVFMFMIWFCGIAGLLPLFIPADAKLYKPQSPLYSFVSGVFGIAFAVGTIWAGHIVAAAVYCIAIMTVRGYSDRCRDLAEGCATSLKEGQ